jgi:hypothetical protein
VTRRDTYIVSVIAVLGAIGALWFLALAPKREKLSAIDKDVAEARQVLDQAKQEKVKFAQDQIAFPRLYASLGRLGKAVPADDDVPTLLVQLNHAAARANVNFQSVELKVDQEAAQAAAAPPAPPAGAEGGEATPPAEGEAAPPAGGEATPPAGGAATAAAGTAAPAPAAGAPGADPAATPGTAAAGFKALPFEYKFRGDFFDLEDLVHNMTSLVERRNQELAVTGRLITIQGFTLKRGSITIKATSYMLPADQGLFAGATPQGPAAAAAPQPAAAGAATPPTPAPPTAAVTSP